MLATLLCAVWMSVLEKHVAVLAQGLLQKLPSEVRACGARCCVTCLWCHCTCRRVGSDTRARALHS